ncbi:aldehyde dehydrogenase family protein [Peribacillus frigoritolerans]|nr:aldehyde dehydrogenase family protein [Peribacillus frigoritolerans]
MGENKNGNSDHESCRAHVEKKSLLNWAGKNPNIVFADSNLEEVIETTLKSSFMNQGEVCLCGSRIYVQQELYDEFLEKDGCPNKKN